MRLVRELLVPFPGRFGLDGVCHVRVYRPAGMSWGRPAVVIVGALDDIQGTSITIAIEIVAAVVRRLVFPSGGRFVLVEHYTRSSG